MSFEIGARHEMGVDHLKINLGGPKFEIIGLQKLF